MTASIDHLEARLAELTARGERSEAVVDLTHALSDALLPRTPERILAMNEDMLALSEALGYTEGVATSLRWIGFSQYMMARYEPALQALQRALSLYEEIDHPHGRALIYTSFAYVQHTLGNYDEALAAGLKAQPIYEALPEPARWHAWNQIALGNTYLALQAYEQALEATRQGYTLCQEMGFALGQARALTHLASIYQHLDEHAEAVVHLQRSLPLFRDVGDALGESRCLHDLGCVYQRLGALDEALAYHRQSLQIREALGNEQARCTSLVNLGQLYLQRDTLDQAIPLLHQALDIAEAIQARPKAYQAHEGLAAAYERTGALDRALHHYKAYHALKEVVVGEETRSKFNRLQISHAVAKAERDAEIERLKNIELQRLLDELRTTQQQLIHAEKMASLGALTAGIAHEIKNPLNFINTFAALSRELADDLQDELDAERGDAERDDERDDERDADEIALLLSDLKANAEKIEEHGRRADSIVRSMLEHSRGSSGERRAVAVNALVEEYVALAYHGKRAQTPGFNVEIRQDLSGEVGEVEMVPQEIGRVVLNLVGNAFDAVHERAQAAEDEGAAEPYAPRVAVTTHRRAASVEIRVEDNGVGIPEAVQARVFEPFFTTKPAGSGTGLGLSLSYEIVVQGHGGALEVESAEGHGTAFIVRLPAPA